MIVSLSLNNQGHFPFLAACGRFIAKENVFLVVVVHNKKKKNKSWLYGFLQFYVQYATEHWTTKRNPAKSFVVCFVKGRRWLNVKGSEFFQQFYLLLDVVGTWCVRRMWKRFNSLNWIFYRHKGEKSKAILKVKLAIDYFWIRSPWDYVAYFTKHKPTTHHFNSFHITSTLNNLNSPISTDIPHQCMK